MTSITLDLNSANIYSIYFYPSKGPCVYKCFDKNMTSLQVSYLLHLNNYGKKNNKTIGLEKMITDCFYENIFKKENELMVKMRNNNVSCISIDFSKNIPEIRKRIYLSEKELLNIHANIETGNSIIIEYYISNIGTFVKKIRKTIHYQNGQFTTDIDD